MASNPRDVRDIVTIGASAGGVPAIRDLLSHLEPGVSGSLFVVVHRSPFHPSRLAEVIRGRSAHRVVEPADGQAIEPGYVYLAPRDLHLVVEPGRIRLVRGPKEHFTRPAVDPLFRSAAAAYGPRVVGVVLSGGGYDGKAGLLAIKAGCGIAIVQRPEESLAKSMPHHAIVADRVDAILPVVEIARALERLMRGHEIRASSAAAT
jgi:two-component system, chemotaxis family, protein-glutamate methylesterase/glutaminase